MSFNNNNKLIQAANLMKQASDLLNQSVTEQNVQNENQPSQLQSNSLTMISETTNRARRMLEQSSSRGSFRRLNNAERLRAAASQSPSIPNKKRKKQGVEKAFEFALIADEESDSEDLPDTLKWDSIVADGVIMISGDDKEKEIRKKINNAVVKNFPMLSETDFEFVKVRQKKITKPSLADGAEFDFQILKKIVGQGTLYIRLKPGYRFLLRKSEEISDDKDLTQASVSCTSTLPRSPASTSVTPPAGTSVTPPAGTSATPSAGTSVTPPAGTSATPSAGTSVTPPAGTSATPSAGTSVTPPAGTLITSYFSAAPSSTSLSLTAASPTRMSTPTSSLTPNNFEELLGSAVRPCEVVIAEVKQLCTNDPTEVLRFLQQRLTTGRALFVQNIMENESEMEGFVNLITVDRDDVIATTFDELKSISDFKVTFQVDFIGESALDYGGVRLEWIGLMNRAMREKYFEKGLKEHLKADYFYVGVMAGISLIQGGISPCIFNEIEVDYLFNPTENSDVMSEVLRGMEEFHLASLFRNFPVLRNLFVKSSFKLSPQFLIKTLQISNFSPEGSTAYSREKKIYSYFVKYLREVASGRRGRITLNDVLRFVTGCEEVPVLGFSVQPTFKFVTSKDKGEDEPKDPKKVDFTPKAHICANELEVPRGMLSINLPPVEHIHNIYDLAFANKYFGQS